jgi:hypothetical protein
VLEATMDDRRFDAFTRTLSAGSTRRQVTRLLGGWGLVGVLDIPTIREAAAAALDGGYHCTKGRQCKTDKCLRNNTCSCSSKYLTCKPPTNPCKQATCNVATKRCVTRKQTNGTPCTVRGFDGTCVDGACTDCGQRNQACCSNGICGAGGTCVGFPFRCVPCGDAGQPCCDPDYCAEGECNIHRICGACGDLGQMCCIQGACDIGLTCRDADEICINPPA